LRAKRFLPLLAFLVLAALLYKGLSIDPTELPAARLGQPFPDFVKAELKSGQPISAEALMPGPALVNVWPHGVTHAGLSTPIYWPLLLRACRYTASITRMSLRRP